MSVMIISSGISIFHCHLKTRFPTKLGKIFNLCIFKRIHLTVYRWGGEKCTSLVELVVKGAHHDFSTTSHYAKFHTQVKLQHRRFTLEKLQRSTFAASMQKQLPKLTADWNQNLADMTHFYVSPRFCEMKTVNKLSTHSAGRLGHPYPAVLWPCMPPWKSHHGHYVFPSASFHWNNECVINRHRFHEASFPADF